jgi:hypothetical protein
MVEDLLTTVRSRLMTDNTQPPLTAAELDKMESHPGCDDIRRRLIRELRDARARLAAIDAAAKGDVVEAIMDAHLKYEAFSDVCGTSNQKAIEALDVVRSMIAAEVARADVAEARAERAEAERDAMRPVVEAAKTWNRAKHDSADAWHKLQAVRHAVDNIAALEEGK